MRRRREKATGQPGTWTPPLASCDNFGAFGGTPHPRFHTDIYTGHHHTLHERTGAIMEPKKAAPLALAQSLPYDILSKLFVEICRLDWKATFRLGSVCRFWRQSLLNTPQAWAFVRLDNVKSAEALRILAERSAFPPLCIDARQATGAILRIGSFVDKYAERIQCLKLHISDYGVLNTPLPNLTKLAITGEGMYAKTKHLHGRLRYPGDLLDGTIFPKLRCLHAGFLLDSLRNDPIPSITEAVLPPIEELAISTHYPQFASHVIQRLAHNLITLHVRLGRPPVLTHIRKTDIVFPRLRHLSIEQAKTPINLWPFRARTPNLSSYQQRSMCKFAYFGTACNRHTDTSTAERLSFMYGIDFTFFPHVREITTNSDGIRCVLSRIRDFPLLEKVHGAYRHEINSRWRVDTFNHRHHDRKIEWSPITTSDIIALPHTSTWLLFQQFWYLNYAGWEEYTE